MNVISYKYRLELTKGEELRYISHLDYAELVRRAVLRAKLPAAYSEGFNPHLKMTFLAALALGVTSDGEYMDIDLTEEVIPDEIKTRLAAQLPAGVIIKAAKRINPLSVWRKAQPDLAVYRVVAPLAADYDVAAIETAIKNFNAEPEIFYTRQTPKKTQNFEIKQYLAKPIARLDATAENELALRMEIKITPEGSIKPNEILGILSAKYGSPIVADEAAIHRQALTFKGKSLMNWI